MKPTRLLGQLDRATLGVWLALALFAALFFTIHASSVQDDAYITYRYARNLSQGLGFVYNPNERVLGTTTPLFTLVLAAGAFVSKLDVVTVSLVIGALSLWIGAGTLYQLGQAQSKSLGLAVALIYITNPLLSQFVGMESYFLVCLLLLAAWAYIGRRLRLASLLCGLLALVRYEMVLLVGLLTVIDFRTNRRLPFWLLPGLAPVVLWMIFAWAQFGSPLPLSAEAKLAASRVPFPVGAGLYEYSFVSTFQPDFIVLGLFVMGVMAALVMRRLPRGYDVIVLFGLVYFCVASTVAGSFPWYYAPLLPAFAVMVAGGMQVASDLPGAVHRGWNAQQRDVLAGRLLWPILAGAVAIQLVFWRNDYELLQRQAFDSRYMPYMQVAEWLQANAAPHQTLATYEIGYLGYFTDMTIIDLEGLVTPGLSTWVKDGGDAMLAHGLQLYAPDFVILSANDRSHVAIISHDPRYHLEREFAPVYQLYRKAPG